MLKSMNSIKSINYFCKFSFARKKKLVNPLNSKLSQLKLSQDSVNPYLKTHTGLFPYLPLNDHPLVPGYTRFLPMSLKLSDKISELVEKDETQKFVFSVVKENKSVDQISQIKQLLEQLNYVPEITSSSQVYDIGCICELKLTDNKESGTSAFILPLSICKIESFTIEPTPNEIGEVKAKIYFEEDISEDRLKELIDSEVSQQEEEKLQVEIENSIKSESNDKRKIEKVDYFPNKETLIKFHFLKKMIEKTLTESKDEQFIRIISALQQNYNTDSLNETIWMAVACLALPKFFHKYGFLTSEVSSNDIQNILSKTNVFERLETVIKLFSDFSNKINLWEKLEFEYDHSSERKKINEKLQSIYQNLKNMFETDKDDKNIQVERFKKNMENKTPPEHIMKVFKEELERFMSMDKHSMESNLIRNYLDILTSLPYGVYTKENYDLENAKKILNETHFGMNSVKERILECIAVAKLKGKVNGKILCFSGPPGVGKTSIGESIAKSLNRKFHRIALGGDKDTSSLKGFRRTYVGSMPGKIINALKKTGTENPVILLDEIDKLTGRNHQGDPSSVLLEVLDKEQNHMFTDDYLDVAVDLSKVFFICTANDLSNVPQPLLDRLEVIDVSGYTTQEKKFIFNEHLKNKAIVNAGLDDESKFVGSTFNVDESAINKLITDYCRESGVRSLQRYTNRIYEKIAYHIINNPDEKHIEVNYSNLKKFIGNAHFNAKRIYEKTPIGVSVGLGFNNYGGTIMYIEATKSDFSGNKKEGIIITGNVGKVMSESCSIAISFAKNFIKNNLNLQSFFEQNSIHLHFIEGAVSKDGPSAGTAITTSLLSLALDKSIKSDVAMTGEISLMGKVLPIGGLKEKIMAAKREGMKIIIVPKQNMSDVEEIESEIKEGLEIHFVENYEEIYRICFN